jgi:chromosome segregation ATPase
MKNKIFAICEELQKNGVKPTLEKVREALGGGSFSTINPILKEWKEQQSTSEQPSLELPPEAMQAVSQAAALIWKIASDKSTELTNSIKTEFETLLKEANAEKEEALKEIARLEQTAAKLSGDNESQAQQISALNLQLQKLQLSHDADSQHIEEFKTELKQVHNEANTLSAQVQKLELLLSESTDKYNKLNEKSGKERIEFDNLTNAAIIKEQELNAALKEAISAKDKTLQDAKEINEEAKKQAKELNALNLQVQKQQLALDACEKQNSELKADLKAYQEELKEAISEAAMLKGQLAVYEKMEKGK